MSRDTEEVSISLLPNQINDIGDIVRMLMGDMAETNDVGRATWYKWPDHDIDANPIIIDIWWIVIMLTFLSKYPKMLDILYIWIDTSARKRDSRRMHMPVKCNWDSFVYPIVNRRLYKPVTEDIPGIDNISWDATLYTGVEYSTAVVGDIRYSVKETWNDNDSNWDAIHRSIIDIWEIPRDNLILDEILYTDDKQILWVVL